MKHIRSLEKLNVGDSVIIIEGRDGNVIYTGTITYLTKYGDITLNDSFSLEWYDDANEQFVIRIAKAPQK